MIWSTQLKRVKPIGYGTLALTVVLSIMPAPLVRSQITPTINQGTLDRAILSDPIPQPQSTTPVCRAVDTYYLRRTQAADDLLDQDEDRLQAQSLAVQRVDQEIADVERRIERAERERASGGSDPDLQSYINDLKERLAQLQQRRDQLNATRPERRTQRNRLNSIYVVVKNSQLAELNRRGVQAFDAGEFDRALRFFDAIIQQAEELGDPAAQLAAKANSATVYEAQADYATALTVLQAALASAGQTAPQAARIQLDVARVYDKLGSDNQAQAEYQAALRISEQQGRVADRAAALSSLGFLYNSQGNYQAALQHFAQAREALNTVRLDGRAILHEEHLILAGMGKAQMQLGNHSAAMESYTHALALSQNCNNLIVAAMALNGLGEVHQTLGQTNQSLDAYQQSLQTRRTVGDAAGEAETLANIGAWYVAQGQPTLGIVFYKQAVKRLEAIRTKIETLTLDQQSAYATSVTATYRELANLLLQQDRVLEAQQVLDLLKVQELHDFLKDVHQPIEGTRTGEQLTFLPEENTLLQIFDRTLAQGDLSNFENRSDVTSNVSELASRASLQKVNADLLRSLQDNIQRIAPDSAILYPVIFEDRVDVILIPAEGEPITESTSIAQVELERLIAQFQERLRTKFPDGKGNPAEPAQELYHLLVEPLEPTLEQHGVQTLIYAADNQLRYIPLAALFDGNQWLIERFQINNVTAASLTDFATSSRSRGFTSVLAAAYSETPAPFSVGETPYRFDGLKHTIDEVSVVASLGETARTLVNREFNLTSVEANLEAHQFIHFATHAAFVDGAPEESFILLGDEGRLSIRQINDWNLENIELIVLSACETAVSSDFGSGEEILGFGYQIQRAGARGGVATLWLVKDQSTLPFMRFFYAHIKGGELNYAEALRAAQLSLIYGSRPREDGTYEANDSSSPQEGVYSVYSHPHHWAPFILIGNGL